jgi:hypothetical protein
MKQFGLGRRLMSLLLALAMIVAMIPAIQPTRANAAVGDIEDIGTGLTGDIDTSDTISWPIKIYDYLEDGMLFEYSSANGTAVYDESYSQTGGGLYGGGAPMPVTTLGSDYTSDWVYTSNTNNKGKDSTDTNYYYNPSINYIVKPLTRYIGVIIIFS